MLNFKIQRKSAVALPSVIVINGCEYALHVRRYSRSRSITLRTDPVSQTIRVTCPPYLPARQVTDFIGQKSDWIENSFAKAGPLLQLRPGTIFPFRGNEVAIAWKEEWSRNVECDRDCLRVGGPGAGVGKRIETWLKKQARTELLVDIADYSHAAAIVPPVLALSNARRRWGSCSSNGHIRINWRLIMAPDHVRRSVVAHEIAHLRHMDHSRAFYIWLDQLYEGDRKAADLWLKRYGARLYAVTAE